MAESTITSKNQTTVPKEIRQKLGLGNPIRFRRAGAYWAWPSQVCSVDCEAIGRPFHPMPSQGHALSSEDLRDSPRSDQERVVRLTWPWANDERR